MFKLRPEVSAYVRVCEHLIASTTIYGDEKLTADECELVEYYTVKIGKLTQGSTPDALQLDMLSALLRHDTVAVTHSDVDIAH